MNQAERSSHCSVSGNHEVVIHLVNRNLGHVWDVWSRCLCDEVPRRFRPENARASGWEWVRFQGLPRRHRLSGNVRNWSAPCLDPFGHRRERCKKREQVLRCQDGRINKRIEADLSEERNLVFGWQRPAGAHVAERHRRTGGAGGFIESPRRRYRSGLAGALRVGPIWPRLDRC